ncbi:MAG TPA: serine protease [Baekduia sp.]|nr:serine protease [Baekduia sp.]
MRRSAFALALVATLLCLPAAATVASPRATASIVNGTDATIAQAPYQVAVARKGFAPFDGQFCGGFVLDATHVGTAAHCVMPTSAGLAADPATLEVIAGTAVLRTAGGPAAGEQVVDVEAVSFIPSWRPEIFRRDAAVLTLKTPLTLAAGQVESIGPVFAQPPVGGSLPTTGWGCETWSDLTGCSSSPATLRQATLVRRPDADCQGELYPGFDTDTMLCAQGAEGVPGDPVADTCTGDSGGPVVHDPVGPDALGLAGIVSFGLGCGDPEYPGVYTEIRTEDPATNQLTSWLTTQHPDAPRPVAGSPSLTGTPAPGEQLSCQSTWTNTSEPVLHVIRDGTGATVTGVSAGDAVTYTLTDADRGRSFACVATGRGDGGYGTARSALLAVPPPPAPAAPEPPAPASPPAPPAPVEPASTTTPPLDTKRPRSRVVRSRCTRSLCSVQVQVTDPPYSAGVRGLSASGRVRSFVPCARNPRRTCTRTRDLAVTRRPLGGGRWLVRARFGRVGTATLALVASDRAGNRQRRATTVVVRFGARPKKR